MCCSPKAKEVDIVIKDHVGSRASLISLFAVLSLALASAGPYLACSMVQSEQGSEGVVSDAPKAQQLWKFETGG